MVSINLLPWRKYTYIYQQKIIKKTIIIFIILTIFILIAAHVLLLKQRRELEVDIHHLEYEKNRFVSLQTLVGMRTRALNPENAMKEKVSNRSMAKQLLAALRKPYEGSVCFNDISRHKNVISFSGHAKSSTDLTDYLKSGSLASLFSEIKMVKLEWQGVHHMTFLFEAIDGELNQESYNDAI